MQNEHSYSEVEKADMLDDYDAGIREQLEEETDDASRFRCITDKTTKQVETLH